MTLDIGIEYDAGQVESLKRRIDASLWRLGNEHLFRELAAFLHKENRRLSLQGLNRHEGIMRPWIIRMKRSDYHGRLYRYWTNYTILIPFREQSRRIDAFMVRAERKRLFGIGYGKTNVFVGFTAKANKIPLYWQEQGRDVLGIGPTARRGLGLLLTTHATRSHKLLHRAANLLGF